MIRVHTGIVAFTSVVRQRLEPPAITGRGVEGSIANGAMNGAGVPASVRPVVVIDCQECPPSALRYSFRYGSSLYTYEGSLGSVAVTPPSPPMTLVQMPVEGAYSNVPLSCVPPTIAPFAALAAPL